MIRTASEAVLSALKAATSASFASLVAALDFSTAVFSTPAAFSASFLASSTACWAAARSSALVSAGSLSRMDCASERALSATAFAAVAAPASLSAALAFTWSGELSEVAATTACLAVSSAARASWYAFFAAAAAFSSSAMVGFFFCVCDGGCASANADPADSITTGAVTAAATAVARTRRIFTGALFWVRENA